MAEVDLVLDCRNAHGEGVSWCSREHRLYWVDIFGRKLWRLDPATGETWRWPTEERICTFALRGPDQVVAAFESGFVFLDLTTGAVERIATVEADLPTTRLNDGRCDRQGRFVVGGMDEAPDCAGISNVYRLDPDRTVTRVLDGIGCANSICFSPDGRTMYFTDTPTGQIWAYAYDIETGTPGDRRLLYDFAGQEGTPDGSTVDAEGYLWNAVWNGRRVVRIAPDGRLDRVFDMPVYNPTCVAFGGRDLDTLYITPSPLGMSGEQLAAEPGSGSLFAIKPGVSGLPEPAFAG